MSTSYGTLCARMWNLHFLDVFLTMHNGPSNYLGAFILNLLPTPRLRLGEDADN